MNFIIEAHTDIGTHKTNNEDAYTYDIAKATKGNVAFAVVCDGMGGLAKGELASATVVKAFNKWFKEKLPQVINSKNLGNKIKNEWNQLVLEENFKISEYSNKNNIAMGTTIVCCLVIDNRCFVANIGDSRAYMVTDKVKQITRDHTLVAREIEKGKLTKEQAKSDKRKHLLLQCIGASNIIKLDFYSFELKEETTLILCTDGFSNELTDEDILRYFNIQFINDDKEELSRKINQLIQVAKSRQEKDNITALILKIREKG